MTWNLALVIFWMFTTASAAFGGQEILCPLQVCLAKARDSDAGKACWEQENERVQLAERGVDALSCPQSIREELPGENYVLKQISGTYQSCPTGTEALAEGEEAIESLVVPREAEIKEGLYPLYTGIGTKNSETIVINLAQQSITPQLPQTIRENHVVRLCPRVCVGNVIGVANLKKPSGESALLWVYDKVSALYPSTTERHLEIYRRGRLQMTLHFELAKEGGIKRVAAH